MKDLVLVTVLAAALAVLLWPSSRADSQSGPTVITCPATAEVDTIVQAPPDGWIAAHSTAFGNRPLTSTKVYMLIRAPRSTASGNPDAPTLNGVLRKGLPAGHRQQTKTGAMRTPLSTSPPQQK